MKFRVEKNAETHKKKGTGPRVGQRVSPERPQLSNDCAEILEAAISEEGTRKNLEVYTHDVQRRARRECSQSRRNFVPINELTFDRGHTANGWSTNFVSEKGGYVRRDAATIVT